MKIDIDGVKWEYVGRRSEPHPLLVREYLLISRKESKLSASQRRMFIEEFERQFKRVA
jgi:hypothetical protein